MPEIACHKCSKPSSQLQREGIAWAGPNKCGECHPELLKEKLKREAELKAKSEVSKGVPLNQLGDVDENALQRQHEALNSGFAKLKGDRKELEDDQERLAEDRSAFDAEQSEFQVSSKAEKDGLAQDRLAFDAEKADFNRHKGGENEASTETSAEGQ